MRDGRLRLRLRFQPAGTGTLAAQFRLGGSEPPAEDYDGDGSNELVAGYAISNQASSALVPFAVDWVSNRYTMVPLTPQKPRLSERGLDAEAVRFRREAYEERRSFRNAVRERRFRALEVSGYRVQAYALVEKPRWRLLTGYFSALPVFGRPQRLELQASQLRKSEMKAVPCTPTYPACRAHEASRR